ncbi:MAG: PepSY domain-containing protein, partial [Pseudonocardia sp.]
KLTTIGILAHMGSLLGLVSQLALTAMAVGLLCVLFWGYRMWWQRRPTRNGWVSLTAPAPRGVLRGLSQPLVFVIVLITVAVGWAIPLLGVSLLIFLATDVAVGAATRMRSA